MKLAVIILSDPKNGDEALGRVFNGLAAAADAQSSGDEVQVVFQGAGTRWPKELSQPGHPANALYNAVRPVVAGASRGCAVVFGAADSVKECGLRELADNALPGTPGLASLRRFAADGWTTLTF